MAMIPRMDCEKVRDTVVYFALRVISLGSNCAQVVTFRMNQYMLL